MHRCLLIHENLSSIFELVDEKRYLAVLARTCHLFSDPALDILWRNVEFSTLVRYTVPSHLFDNPNPYPLLFRAVPAVSDLDRFFIQAARVRSLRLNVFSSSSHPLSRLRVIDHVDVSVLDAFSSHGTLVPLIPKLHSLMLTWEGRDVFPYWHLFLCGSIRRLEGPSSDIVPALARIQEACLYMEHVGFTKNDPGTTVDRAFPRLFFTWNHLRSLDMHFDQSLGCQTLKDISMLPALKNMNLQFSSDLGQTPFFKLSSMPGRLNDPWEFRVSFSELQTLRLWTLTRDLVDCTEVLKRAVFPALKEFRAEYQLFRRPDLENLIRIVACNCPAYSTLTSIQVLESWAYNFSDVDHTDWHRISDSALRPLLAYSQLTSVDLSSSCIFTLSDAFVEEMAVAWKSLKSLRIGPKDCWRNESKISLRGLASLALHCRDLEFIALPINAMTVPPLSSLGLTDGHRSESVRRLNVGYSPLSRGAIHDAAATIKYIFPNLVNVLSAHYSDSWYEVMMLQDHASMALLDILKMS